jgi:ABC-type amino acid transport substrate-binding protein
MSSKVTVLTFLFLFFCAGVTADEKKLTFAVGHDHHKMITPDYPMYNAKWEFVVESLALLGYTVEFVELPWARAKHLTQVAKADGLFLAANLPGREKWAVLSDKLGYGVFGGFYHVDNPGKNEFIAGIRLGSHDRLLSDLPPEELLSVATAHQGYKLLFNKKIDLFVMSESYGRYLLNTELQHYSAKIRFDSNKIEKRSTHIAFSKDHPKSLEALKVVNSAIALGIKQGLYQAAMERNNVPKRMQIKLEK